MTFTKMMLAGVLILMAFDSSSGSGTIPNCKEKKEIVDRHNKYRRAEGATNMKKLIWKDDLAKIAANYSSHCLWKHGDLERPDLPYILVGQNLYTSTKKKLSFLDVVKVWFNEKSDYTFDNLKCAKDKMCGHYTQVVWANTSYVGCGYTECAKLKFPGKDYLSNYLFVVCDYGPTGNFEKTPMYKKGKGCSNCSEGFETCEDKLCSSGEGYGDLNLTDLICHSSHINSSFITIATTIILIHLLLNG